MAAVLQSILTEEYCRLAAFTCLGCEYFVNLPQEIELFWKRRVSGASVLFLTNRYLSLLGRASTFAVTSSDEGCDIYVNAEIAINLLPYFPWAAFASLRTYALARGRFRLPLAVLVFVLSVVPVGVNFANYRWVSSIYDPMIGCLQETSVTPELQKYFTIASRTCLIVADLVVVGVTWRTTYRTTQLVRVVAAGRQSKHTFSGTMLRDGTVYFLVIVTLNILHLLFTMLAISSDSFQSTSDITYFTEPVTSILVSRFILDLQEVNQSLADPQLSDLPSGQGSINFVNRVIGSLGSSLPHPGDTWLEDEELDVVSYHESIAEPARR